MQDLEHSEYLENTISPSCPSCGSNLAYSAELKKIACDYCGYSEEVDQRSDKIVEQSLHNAVQDAVDYIPEEVGKKVFDCENCGAKFMVESDQIKVKCGFVVPKCQP